MKGSDREVWIEIGSLTLCVASLILFVPVGYLVTFFIAHWLLTDGAPLPVAEGVYLIKGEMLIGVAPWTLIGIFLLILGMSLRRLLDDDE